MQSHILIPMFITILGLSVLDASTHHHIRKIKQFKKTKHYEKVPIPKKSEDELEISENIVLADKVKGESEKTVTNKGKPN